MNGMSAGCTAGPIVRWGRQSMYHLLLPISCHFREHIKRFW